MPGIPFGELLPPSDCGRVERSLAALARADFSDFAITGGLALRAHLALAGAALPVLPLNDLDTVVSSFDVVPGSLAETFIFPHVHASAPAGKTLFQLVAPEEALRVDVFRALGGTMSRTRFVWIGNARLRVVSLEDLAARTAALLMGLARGKVVDPKHARAFEAIVQVLDLGHAEEAWRGHRRPDDPETLAEGVQVALELVRSHGHLLAAGVYETDTTATCPKCRNEGRFQVADKSRVMGILGYC